MIQVQTPSMSQTHYLFQVLQDQERANMNLNHDLYKVFYDEDDLHVTLPLVANNINSQNIGDNNEEVSLNNCNGNIDEDPVESRAPIVGNIVGTNFHYNDVRFQCFIFKIFNVREGLT